MTEEKKNAPALRFAGFTDDWEQSKLGEIATIVGGGTPSTKNPEYWDGDINWYSPAEILDQIYVKRSRRRITQLSYDNSSAKLLPTGTVLFTSFNYIIKITSDSICRLDKMFHFLPTPCISQKKQLFSSLFSDKLKVINKFMGVISFGKI